MLNIIKYTVLFVMLIHLSGLLVALYHNEYLIVIAMSLILIMFIVLILETLHQKTSVKENAKYIIEQVGYLQFLDIIGLKPGRLIMEHSIRKATKSIKCDKCEISLLPFFSDDNAHHLFCPECDKKFRTPRRIVDDFIAKEVLPFKISEDK